MPNKSDLCLSDWNIYIYSISARLLFGHAVVPCRDTNRKVAKQNQSVGDLRGFKETSATKAQKQNCIQT